MGGTDLNLPLSPSSIEISSESEFSRMARRIVLFSCTMGLFGAYKFGQVQQDLRASSFGGPPGGRETIDSAKSQ